MYGRDQDIRGLDQERIYVYTLLINIPKLHIRIRSGED